MSIHPNQENITALDSFLHTPLDIRLGHHLKQAPETAVLALYRKVAANVPAYRQFLAKHNIEPGKISTFADFQCLPLMTKQNYVLAYPLMARCYQGRLDDNEMIAISSGSTGNPTAWPRSTRHELDIAIRFEQIFNESLSYYCRNAGE